MNFKLFNLYKYIHIKKLYSKIITNYHIYFTTITII